MFIHIGLGKCSTTYIQNHIFPKIAKKINYKYFNQDLSEKFNYLDYKIHPFENLKIKFKKKSLISLEILSGDLFYNPYYYYKASIINSKIFPKASSIIITLREPVSFASSCYSELLANVFSISKRNFFIKKKINQKNKFFFDYTKLNYKKLIKFYTDKFDVVYVVKMEDCRNLNLWSKIFKNSKIKKFKLKKKIINKGLSSVSLNILYFTNKLVNLFGNDLRNYSFYYKEFMRTYIEKLVIKFGMYKKIRVDNEVKKIIEKNNKFFYKNLVSGKYYKKKSKILFKPLVS